MEWQGPMWNDCGGCNFIRRVAGVDPGMDPNRRYCVPCGKLGEVRLTTLVHNLAIAAALCRAYLLGADGAVSWAMNGRGWEPGCNRPAPGVGE